MKKELETILAKLEKLFARAEEMAESDNDVTAARYENVLGHLEAAQEAIEEAIAEF